MRVGRPHASLSYRCPPWSVRFEPTAAAGFHVVLRGSMRLLRPDENPLKLGAGDVVLLPHGSAHELAVCEDQTILVCGGYVLDRHRLHPLVSELAPVIHFPAHDSRHQALAAGLDVLAHELREPRLGTTAVLPAVLDMLLVFMLRAWIDEQPQTQRGSRWAAALRDPPVAAGLEAMHSDPAHGWTVAELGSRGGLSRAAFARRFMAAIGQPPLAYLTWWRMVTAARLLLEPNASLPVVADQVGYESEFAFAKAFKRVHGVAPGAYRRARG